MRTENRGKIVRIESIESLRLLMALIVMQSHLTIADWSMQYFYNGNLAVIFFFMVSGFGLTYKGMPNKMCGRGGVKWSLLNEYKNTFLKMKKIYFWYILFIAISLPWQFRELMDWHDKNYAIVGTLATIFITPTMLQSLFGFYQASHLGLGAYWFISTIFILYLIYPILWKINCRVVNGKNGTSTILFCITATFVFSLFVWNVLHFFSINTIFNDLDYGSPLTCVFYFGLGILFCDLYWLCKNNNIRDLTILEIIILLGFIVWCLGRNSFFLMKDEWRHAIDVSICMALLGVFEFGAGGGCPEIFYKIRL